MNMSFPTTDAVPESQPDSPILALLLSNNLPLKSEVVIVRAKIARIEADLARYKAILSPVRCLPQEVLGLIFIYCVPEYPNLDVRQPPWTLSQVDSSWREIVLSTPSLWNVLDISLDPDTHGYLSDPGPSCQTFLERSGGSGLTLNLYTCHKAYDASSSIIDLLFSQSERWQHVNLTIPDNILGKLSAVIGHLSSLESLEFAVPDGLDKNSDLDGFFAIAPQLRKVTLSDFPSFNTLNLPWPQLTDYTGDCPRMECALDVLRQASSLVKCTFHPTPQYFSTKSPLAMPLRLPNLRELTITADADPCHPPGDLLDRLEIPDLVCLDVASIDDDDDDEYDGTDIIDHLISLVTRSSCSLHKFSLHRKEAYDTHLCRFLQLTPHLEELSLRGYITDEFLLSYGTRPFLLPRLRTLKLTGTFSQDVLGRVLESRISAVDEAERNGGTSQVGLIRLRKLVIGAQEQPLHPDLSHLRLRGMDIFFRGW